VFASASRKLIPILTTSPMKVRAVGLSFGEVRMESLLSSDKWRTRRTEVKDQTKNHRATPPASAGNRSLNLQTR